MRVQVIFSAEVVEASKDVIEQKSGADIASKGSPLTVQQKEPAELLQKTAFRDS